MKGETCGECKHYDNEESKELGQGVCRFNPPQCVPVTVQTPLGVSSGIKGMYPPVKEDSKKCGRFESKFTMQRVAEC